MIYDKNGNLINMAYGIGGDSLEQAYDVDGNPLLSTSDLVVMSYNVQWFAGINGNQTMQESILDTYKPDIIGMQEFQRATQDTIPAFATALLSADYPYLHMGNYGNKNAIASKYQLTDFATIPHSTQTMDGQSYSTATIMFGGKEILLLNAHLTTSSYETTKVEQAKEIFDALQGHDYFIMMGDFNTVCKSVNDTEYTIIMKQFIDAGYHSANCSAQHGFLDTWTSGSTASGTWYPCDHVITSPNIEITNVVVDTDKIDIAAQTGQSIDHLPIIAYLTIN